MTKSIVGYARRQAKRRAELPPRATPARCSTCGRREIKRFGDGVEYCIKGHRQ